MKLNSFNFVRHAAILCGLMCLFTFSAIAQRSQLTGTVTDPTGLAIGGASIDIINESTNVHRQTTSANSGDYSMPGLESGKYSIHVMKEGFEALDRTGVTLTVSTTTRLDLRLSIGTQTETVTVTGDAALLQPENAQLSTTVSRAQYDELPLVQQGRIRSPTAFVYLAPSVQGNYNASGAENTAATNYISVNGSQMKNTEFYLSGLSCGQMANVGSYNESAPPVDAVQEFKMITTMVPADYGHTGAAAGIFAVRNGTNELHGSAYEYLRNNALDGQSWGATTKLFTRQNEFGATIGGPIVLPKLYNGKNRSFFFFSYGASRKSGADSLKSLQIPTPAQAAGDFSALSAKIYDPATTRLNAAGTGYIRDQFPGNIIPANRIDPFAAKVAAAYPAPNATGTKNYVKYGGEQLLNPDVFTVRVDHQLTGMQHLYGTLVQSRIPRLQLSTPLPQPLTSTYNQFLRATTVRVNHDWTLNARMMNSLAIGYYRVFAQLQPGNDKFQIPGEISARTPTINFSNGYTGISTQNGQKTAEHQYLLGDVFYLTQGRQNIRIGGEYRRVHFNDDIPDPGTNSITTNYLETGDPTVTGTTGDGFASFLLGQIHSGSLTAPMVQSVRYTYAGAFFQDDWKPSTRLTLNLGVRYELETIPTDADDKSSMVDLNTPNPGAGNLKGALIFAGKGTGRSGKRTLGINRYTGFSPRIGMSFQVNPKLVARAGFGLFYSDLGWNMSTGIDNYGFTAAASYASKDNGLTPAFTLASGFPGSPSLDPKIDPTLINGQAADYLSDTVGYFPYTEQWSGSIEYSPKQTWMFELAYVGTQGHRLLDSNFTNINQVASKNLSLGSLLTLPASSAKAQAAGIVLPYAGFSGTVAQALRPYPQYQGLTSVSAKAAYSNYNAIQFITEKRMSHGVRASINYTYAKNLGINSPSWMNGTTDNVLQNSEDPRAEYSLSPLDVRHAVVMNYSYELPFGRGKMFLANNKVMNAVAGGWTASAIQRYQTGFPLPIKTSNPLPIFNRARRPNIVAGVDRSTHLSANEYKPGVNRIINPNAFAQPGNYEFGNAKPTYSDVRSFPVLAEDLSVAKNTQLTEKLKWSISAHFFNAFNRHRATSFDTTLSDAGFGQSTSVSLPRFIQVATRFQF